MRNLVKDGIKSFFSNMTKTTFIVMLLTMASIIIIYSEKKSVVISVDGKESTVITFRGNIQNTLVKNDITLGPKDKINPSLDTKLKDGDTIYIERAVTVNVLVDGKELEIATTEDTVEDVLSTEGIKFSNLDRIEPLPTSPVTAGMKVSITRVETQIVKEYKPVDFSTIVKKDDTLVNTVTKVEQEGQTGEKEITLRVIFENGKEISRNIVNEIVTKQPTQKVLIQGTLNILKLSRGTSKESFSGSAPQELIYRNVLRCTATAYSAEEPGMGTRTASGTTVRRNPNGYSTIAVDPRVIPLGTRVYVEGYGYAVAEDTGGAIKGNKIDVYLNTISDCYNWGVRSVNVYILP